MEEPLSLFVQNYAGDAHLSRQEAAKLNLIGICSNGYSLLNLAQRA